MNFLSKRKAKKKIASIIRAPDKIKTVSLILSLKLHFNLFIYLFIYCLYSECSKLYAKFKKYSRNYSDEKKKNTKYYGEDIEIANKKS